jgi:hypothetical protein
VIIVQSVSAYDRIAQESLDQLLTISFMERFSLFMLGGLCVGGALLTLGLTHRWGEIFPGWLPFLAGKQVPPALAIIHIIAHQKNDS